MDELKMASEVAPTDLKTSVVIAQEASPLLVYIPAKKLAPDVAVVFVVPILVVGETFVDNLHGTPVLLCHAVSSSLQVSSEASLLVAAELARRAEQARIRTGDAMLVRHEVLFSAFVVGGEEDLGP
jgi:hypothetical protein